MIKVKDLAKSFGAIKALDDVSFEAFPGKILALLGPNGAGKTTLLRALVGFIEPDTGKITILQKDPITDRVALLQKIGYVPENTPLYNEMSVFEFLTFIASLKTKSDVRFAINQLGLQEVINQRIETLSKGYRKRVGIAAAILDNPDVLILDEPTEGLDPSQKEAIRDFIRDFSADKIIIISTHVMEEVEALANQVIVLNKGKIVADTTLDGLKKRSKDGNVLSSFLSLMEDTNV